MGSGAKEKSPVGKVPTHVAIIMDGNGRWARQRGLPRLAGHKAGTDNIKRIIEAAHDHQVKMLTLYAFSTENWKRPMEEVRGLMSLLLNVIDREAENLRKNGVQLRHIGSGEGLDRQLLDRIRYAVDLTRENDRIVVNVAFNYGGRAEIVEAARQIVRDGIPPDEITEELFASRLYTAGAPDPDLVIRTAGEMRLSNFLIWQAAYAEYWSTPVFWPDFGKEQFHEAILEYGRRRRKFGALG
ncbi:MAG: polyprenyl diphosphate synthase [Actinobacteria bacterium]|nr:polyprenyl diphosphate synthase [Actinomycetota bacterium]